MQGTFHDHNVFDMGVNRFAHNDAAAKIGPHIGVFHQEVLNGSALRFGEEARIALGVKRVVRVLQARHGVVQPVERACKRVLGVAKRQVLHRVLHDHLHIAVAQRDVVVQVHDPVRRVALPRQGNQRKEVIRAGDVLLFHSFRLRARVGRLVSICLLRRLQRAASNQSQQQSEHGRDAKLRNFACSLFHGLPRFRPSRNVKHVEGRPVFLLVFGLHRLGINDQLEASALRSRLVIAHEVH